MPTPTVAEILPKVKELLEIQFNDFDARLEILIPASMSKLDNEGVTYLKIDTTKEFLFNDYVLCITTQIAQELDLGIDIANLIRQYNNRVTTLREALSLIEL